MEVMGEVKCAVENSYDEVVIDKEKFIKANLVETLKKRYDFNETSVPPPEKMEEGVIIFRGGKFVHNSSEFLIDEMRVGNAGVRIVMWEKTPVVKTAIDDIGKTIESFGIFPKFSRLTPTQDFETQLKAKLTIPTVRLLNQPFLNVIKDFSTQFKEEDYDIEIHPFAIAVAYVFKPNVQKLARKSLTAAELARKFKSLERKSLVIQHANLEDFYEGIVTIRSNFDYETTQSFLEELEQNVPSA